MDTFPWAEFVPVCGGMVAITLFAAAVFDVWRHRQPRAPWRWGLPLGTRTLRPEVVAGLARLEAEHGPWGWLHRDGDQLVIFADPYDRSDGAMRVSTPIPYRAVVDPAAGTVRFLAPALPFVGILLVIFPLSLVALLVNHSLLTHRIEDRLLRLVRALPPAPMEA